MRNRNRKSKSNLKQTSNTWLLLSLFITTYLIFRLILIDTIVTMNFSEFEEFWLSFKKTGASNMSQFYVIFILFGLWALAEMTSIFVLDLSDRVFGLAICSFIFFCLIAIQFIFSAQQSFLKHEYRVNSAKTLTYRLTTTPYVPFYSDWDKFKRQKEYKTWDFFSCFEKSDWSRLKKEFTDSGGIFEKFEIENIELVPEKRSHRLSRIIYCPSIDFK